MYFANLDEKIKGWLQLWYTLTMINSQWVLFLSGTSNCQQERTGCCVLLHQCRLASKVLISLVWRVPQKWGRVRLLPSWSLMMSLTFPSTTPPSSLFSLLVQLECVHSQAIRKSLTKQGKAVSQNTWKHNMPWASFERVHQVTTVLACLNPPHVTAFSKGLE